MTRDTYQKQLEKHLAEYKKLRLGVSAKGDFTYKGVTREYGHILPRELKWLNVPEPFRREIGAYVASHKHIKLHKFFHHLNSSQAFSFALFYPYLTRAPEVLAKALGVSGIEESGFEQVPVPKEGTNVDVWWTLGGAEVYCEVKLSEREFGPAQADERHREKLKSIYGPVLRGQVDDRLLEEPAFFKHYQILRNLWLAARKGREKDHVLFLMPKANAGLTEQLASVLEQIGKPLRTRVRVVYVEPLLVRLVAQKGPDSLGWYARMLQEKYVPGVAMTQEPRHGVRAGRWTTV